MLFLKTDWETLKEIYTKVLNNSANMNDMLAELSIHVFHWGILNK